MVANTENIRNIKTSGGNLKEIREQNESAYVISKYIQDYGFYPPFKNTVSEYLSLGERNLKN